ncbi:MAG: hypothetical protein PHF86_03695 [Candidatus Nanoarchaeia archaeon]|nr:hypothetical protein [Candidatus Nanoarchaeia archaeon]
MKTLTKLKLGIAGLGLVGLLGLNDCISKEQPVETPTLTYVQNSKCKYGRDLTRKINEAIELQKLLPLSNSQVTLNFDGKFIKVDFLNIHDDTYLEFREHCTGEFNDDYITATSLQFRPYTIKYTFKNKNENIGVQLIPDKCILKDTSKVFLNFKENESLEDQMFVENLSFETSQELYNFHLKVLNALIRYEQEKILKEDEVKVKKAFSAE